MIESFDMPDSQLVCRLVELAAAQGAIPWVSQKDNTVLRSLYKTATVESMQLAGGFERDQMEQMDAYIGIRAATNSSEMSRAPPITPKWPRISSHSRN